MAQTPIYRYESGVKRFVQDPTALNNLKLKDNEEIRIKKIYHVNRPYEEPIPEAPKSYPPASTKLALQIEREQNESVFGSREPSEVWNTEEEVEDNLSTISNAGSEKQIRKKSKATNSIDGQLKSLSFAYVQPCPICQPNMLVMPQRRSLPGTLPPLEIDYKNVQPKS
jgi:hypothetical protein